MPLRASRCARHVSVGRSALPAAVLVLALLGCGDDGGSAAGGGGGGGGAPGGAGGAAGSGNEGGAGFTGPLVSCGHAHNDYEHEGPLTEAVGHGFCSFEVDVFLVGTDLLVAHALTETDPSRTLQSLYLDPLRELSARGALPPGPAGGPVLLLVDVKSDAETTYAALDAVFQGYTDILTEFSGGTVSPGAVTAIISGNRAEATIAAQPVRYAAIDGRIGTSSGATAPETPVDLVPLVSQNWNLLFEYDPTGPLVGDDKAKLDGFVSTAHAEGRMIRFWSTDDTPAHWDVLAAAGVDLINVDDLAAFEAYAAALE